MTDHGAGPAGAGGTGRAGRGRVRFAPSPSGDLHVGNVRTALYDWAFARPTGGTFVLRIEDTDAEPGDTPEYIDSAQDTLRWLGLDWDEGPGVGGPYGPYRQSERLDIYAEWVDRFLGRRARLLLLLHARRNSPSGGRPRARRAARAGTTATAATSPPTRSPPTRRRAASRWSGSGCRPGSTTFTDLIRGEVTFDHAHVPDFVLARADGAPLYTLAVAVDDVLMEITHVVRGEDLLSSTPRQIAVYRAMGVPEERFPVFAHLPYVLGPNGQKLSKRNGVVSITWYREQGFLPEAICNYLALLGWSPGENREVVHAGRDGRRVRPGPGEQERRPSSTCASSRRSTATRSARWRPPTSPPGSRRSWPGPGWSPTRPRPPTRS